MKRILLVLACFVLLSGNAWAVESCTGSSEVVKTYSGNDIVLFTWTWVSAADGTASCASSNLYGKLVGVKTVPSSTAAPTDNYDIDVNVGVTDVMGAALDNRDTANTEFAFAQKGTDAPGDVWLAGGVTAEVSAAGASKGGALTLIIIP